MSLMLHKELSSGILDPLGEVVCLFGALAKALERVVTPPFIGPLMKEWSGAVLARLHREIIGIPAGSRVSYVAITCPDQVALSPLPRPNSNRGCFGGWQR